MVDSAIPDQEKERHSRATNIKCPEAQTGSFWARLRLSAVEYVSIQPQAFGFTFFFNHFFLIIKRRGGGSLADRIFSKHQNELRGEIVNKITV